MLEESLLKLCLEYSESLEEAVLSERREESESLFWSSLRGILIHFSCYSKQDLERQIYRETSTCYFCLFVSQKSDTDHYIVNEVTERIWLRMQNHKVTNKLCLLCKKVFFPSAVSYLNGYAKDSPKKLKDYPQ